MNKLKEIYNIMIKKISKQINNINTLNKII